MGEKRRICSKKESSLWGRESGTGGVLAIAVEDGSMILNVYPPFLPRGLPNDPYLPATCQDFWRQPPYFTYVRHPCHFSYRITQPLSLEFQNSRPIPILSIHQKSLRIGYRVDMKAHGTKEFFLT